MRDPDKVGAARAWKIRFGDEMLEAHRREWGSDPAGIASWLINGPYHPAWSWWFVGTVHLRNEPGTKIAQIAYPGATHEIMCWSLDPEARNGRPDKPDVDALERGELEARPAFLTPADWIVQFIVTDDEQAGTLTDLVIEQIVAGRSCDSDFRGWWEDAIHKTAEHLRLGGHPDHDDQHHRFA